MGTVPRMIISPIINYTSDRIWTRFGRRKPFVLIPYFLQGACLILFPFAPNFYALTAVLWLYQIVGSFGATFWPLMYEVIPPAQRGFGQAMQQVLLYAALVLYYSIMIGRFDDAYLLGRSLVFPVTGEQLMYWVCAPMLAITAFVFSLGIKELLPPTRQTMKDETTGKTISPFQFITQFIRDVFNKQWLVLYTLMFAGAVTRPWGLAFFHRCSIPNNGATPSNRWGPISPWAP